MSAIPPPPPESTSRRAIHLSWDVEVSGSRRLRAECADELTDLIFMGPAIFDESDPAAIVSGPFAEMAVAEHQGRCSACQRWARRAS